MTLTVTKCDCCKREIKDTEQWFHGNWCKLNYESVKVYDYCLDCLKRIGNNLRTEDIEVKKQEDDT